MLSDALVQWAVALTGIAAGVSAAAALHAIATFQGRRRAAGTKRAVHVAFLEGMLASADKDLELVIHRRADGDHVFVVEIKTGGSLRRSGVLTAADFARIEPVLAEALAV